MSMGCYEAKGNLWLSDEKILHLPPKELAIRVLQEIGCLAIGWLTTPFVIAAYTWYVFTSDGSYAYLETPGTSGSGLVGFGKRLWSCLGLILFAPWYNPQKLRYTVFPPPCTHNRCKLRDYVSPPQRLNQRMLITCNHLSKCLQHRLGIRTRRPNSHHPPSTFLALPLEIRNLIYFYASISNKRPTIRVASEWRAGPRTHLYDYLAATVFQAEHNANRHRTSTLPAEEVISYILDDAAVVAIHGAPPPTSMLLVCRQMCQEASEDFWSVTGFEVQPLTPKHAHWRPDAPLLGLYDTLFLSKYVERMRKVIVRIDIARFSTSQTRPLEPVQPHTHMFQEMTLQECVARLAPLAEELCKTLATYANRLRVIEIWWVDDFADEINETALETRKTVLRPFAVLVGANVNIGKLVMVEKGKTAVMTMARQALRGYE